MPKVPLPLAVPHTKILFIVCNTYTTEKYKLVVDQFIDSLTVTVNHKKMGYTVFYLHNAASPNFREWLKGILNNAQSDLTVFYAGHGCSIPDHNGYESGGMDKAMLFDDSYAREDDLARYLRQHRNANQRTILLNDCCHSSSIWAPRS
ncbi:hypothetical protein TRFO_19731 [Tritrichomonas foetus]|uniref:Peptidase C14 caspase domain-containing protein n=1 Tax=Tritrichomonas foetus TaxID=1144522 RepID=A0A1J4KM16_9EUKA|nr:hypothetical protein TRFO_19731 [Tritrichomonas foetus]|eukprot:OHT10844.1 hypothetical protein TRFO_19731 [Tritrichomonas foetus]